MDASSTDEEDTDFEMLDISNTTKEEKGYSKKKNSGQNNGKPRHRWTPEEIEAFDKCFGSAAIQGKWPQQLDVEKYAKQYPILKTIHFSRITNRARNVSQGKTLVFDVGQKKKR